MNLILIRDFLALVRGGIVDGDRVCLQIWIFFDQIVCSMLFWILRRPIFFISHAAQVPKLCNFVKK